MKYFGVALLIALLLLLMRQPGSGGIVQETTEKHVTAVGIANGIEYKSEELLVNNGRRELPDFYELNVLDSISMEPIPDLIFNYLTLDGKDWGSVASHAKGLLKVPAVKGQILCSISAPGYFGRICTDRELSQDGDLFLAPSASLQLEFDFQVEKPESCSILLFPPLKEKNAWNLLKARLANLPPSAKRAITSLHDVSQFFNGFDGYGEKEICEFVKTKVWRSLPTALPWSGLVPEHLEFPLNPVSFIRELGSGEEIYWLNLPAAPGYRWMNLSARGLVINPPYEKPVYEKTTNGTISRIGEPSNLSGVFDLPPGELTTIKVKGRAESSIWGYLDYSRYPILGNAHIRLLDLKEKYRDGELFALDMVTEKTLVLNREDGRFDLRGLNPGRKKLIAQWRSSESQIQLVTIEFEIGEYEERNLGLLEVDDSSPLTISCQFLNGEGELLSSENLFSNGEVGGQLLIRSGSPTEPLSLRGEGLFEFNALHDLSIVGLRAEDIKANISLSPLVGLKPPYVLSNRPDNKLTHNVEIKLNSPKTIAIQVFLESGHKVQLGGGAPATLNGKRIKVQVANLRANSGSKQYMPRVRQGRWACEDLLPEGVYAIYVIGNPNHINNTLVCGGQFEVSSGIPFVGLDFDIESGVDFEFEIGAIVNTRFVTLEMIPVEASGNAGMISIVRPVGNTGRVLFRGLPKGWRAHSPKGYWEDFIIEENLVKGGKRQ